MALRKFQPTPSGYDLAPWNDNLRPLLRGERYYERQDGDYDIVVSSGVQEIMAFWVTLHELYSPNGCFLEISREHDVPRIMAMVRHEGLPVALAMVVNSSHQMGTGYVSGRTSLGFLGMFVKPEHRGRRISSVALRWLGAELGYLLDQAETPVLDPCVQANDHIQNWAMANFVLPVELL